MKISKGLIAIIAVVVIVGAWAASAYNSMVGVQEQATTALANVQSTYQRRADLISCGNGQRICCPREADLGGCGQCSYKGHLD